MSRAPSEQQAPPAVEVGESEPAHETSRSAASCPPRAAEETIAAEPVTAADETPYPRMQPEEAFYLSKSSGRRDHSKSPVRAVGGAEELPTELVNYIWNVPVSRFVHQNIKRTARQQRN